MPFSRQKTTIKGLIKSNSEKKDIYVDLRPKKIQKPIDWKEKLGQKMIKKVDDQKQYNFYKGLEDGNTSLPINELRRLNTI